MKGFASAPWLAEMLISRLSPAQCRAARGLLGWSQRDLAARVGVTGQAICLFELSRHKMRPRRLKDMTDVIEGAGVVLLHNDGTECGGLGVRLRNFE